jgi:hypothetical protein
LTEVAVFVGQHWHHDDTSRWGLNGLGVP